MNNNLTARNREMARHTDKIKGTEIPKFKASQLNPIKGLKPIRTADFKISCLAIYLAKGGEYS